MKRLFLIIIASFLLGCQFSSRLPSFGITNLRVENMSSPLGLDKHTPAFSWWLQGSDKDIRQAAWQIKVLQNDEVVWDSGVISNSKQYNIHYAGMPLKENTSYRWVLAVWDQRGRKDSKESVFHVGLLSQDSWKAKWIGAKDVNNRAPYMRKQFGIDKKVDRAYLYVTGVGYYECYLNGKKVGDQVLDPAPSQYQRRVYYQTHDVSKLLNNGSNAMGIILGEAQAASTITKSERFHNRARSYPGPLDAPAAIAMLWISYNDGTEEQVITDASWKVSTGPITYNHFYGGEDYDARLEMPGWDKAGYDDTRWEHVIERPRKAILSKAVFEPIKVVDVLKPIKKVQSSDSVWIFDLGQVIGGWWRLQVEGERGVEVTIKGSATLNEAFFPKELEAGDQLTTVFQHGIGGHYERDAYTVYTLKGGAEESYEPRFFYSSFRYISVTISDPDRVKSFVVQGCTTHSDMEAMGSFECSDPVLTQLHKNTIWTIKAVSQGGPMSNANSEKYGWTGDVHLFAEQVNMTFNAQNFWRKWLDDIHDSQLHYQTGNVVSTIPNYRRDTLTVSPAWGAVYPMLVWNNYLFYDDQEYIDRHYNGIKRWVDFLDNRYHGGLARGNWADHLPPGFDRDGNHITRGRTEESMELIESAYYYHIVDLMKKMAILKDVPADAVWYQSLANKIKNAINNKYFDQEQGCYVVPSAPPGFSAVQASNLVPLQFGIVPNGEEKRVLDHVVEDIRKHGNHLTTGILGTKAMVDVLPAKGYADLLYKLATQETYPSWGYWIKNGATTHWQRWNGHPDHCHAMFGSISNFFVNQVAGICLPSHIDGTIAYKRIVFKPFILDGLSYAKARVPSKYGMVHIDWNKNGDELAVEVQIPAGTSGVFIFPDGFNAAFAKGQELNAEADRNGGSFISLTSGTHAFVLK